MRRVAPAMLLSLIAHALIVLPGVMALATGAAPSLTPEARFEESTIEEVPEPEPKAGRDRSPHSTLTWIGYEEYEEHIAELSEVEQAAFTEATPSPPGMRPVARATAAINEAAERTAQRIADAVDSLVELAVQVDGALASAAIPEPTPPVEPEPEPEPQPTVEPEPTAEPVEEPAPEPQPEEPAGGPPADPGEQSDRESPATSLHQIKDADLKLGKPVVGDGVEVKTKRPRFTPLMRLGSLSRNPIALIEFDHQGLPTLVTIIRSSGRTDVDDRVRSRLYQWAARGERIDELDEDETYPFNVELLLR